MNLKDKIGLSGKELISITLQTSVGLSLMIATMFVMEHYLGFKFFY